MTDKEKQKHRKNDKDLSDKQNKKEEIIKNNIWKI